MVDMILSSRYLCENAIKNVYEPLAVSYYRHWKVGTALFDINGQVIASEHFDCGVDCDMKGECEPLRAKMANESMRWGEPSIQLCPASMMIWAIPIMLNNEINGGILGGSIEISPSPGKISLMPADVRRASMDLLTRAKEANITNDAMMLMNGEKARREQERAEAIHIVKEQNYQSIRDVYLNEEPALISAIKRGDRKSARAILNKVLVVIYSIGSSNQIMLKSLLLELVVTMSRSAIEAGGDPAELLGVNYSSFTELATITNEEELCRWLVEMLERMMNAIKGTIVPMRVLMGNALKYMKDHLDEEISRDEVANIALMSPSHFSRAMKQTFGQSYTDILTKMRVDKARELLVRTEKSLIQICVECGFSDQSYFTKVFSKQTARTPGEYRKQFRVVNQ
jgi:AraC-like DNA-binding protein/ligand-binding sensor protein